MDLPLGLFEFLFPVKQCVLSDLYFIKKSYVNWILETGLSSVIQPEHTLKTFIIHLIPTYSYFIMDLFCFIADTPFSHLNSLHKLFLAHSLESFKDAYNSGSLHLNKFKGLH
jgi:hypothetical protein